MIEKIQPQAETDALRVGLPDTEALVLLADRSHIFGCLDRESPRLELTELASRRQITYIDAASDVDSGGEYGGRIIVANGSGCLFCLGEIDQEELCREQLTPEQRQAHDRVYGISHGALDEAGPSVVCLNAIVASLAVNEFMVAVTAIDRPAGHLIFRGSRRAITESTDRPKPDCPYCGRWHNGGQAGG